MSSDNIPTITYTQKFNHDNIPTITYTQNNPDVEDESEEAKIRNKIDSKFKLANIEYPENKINSTISIKNGIDVQTNNFEEIKKCYNKKYNIELNKFIDYIKSYPEQSFKYSLADKKSNEEGIKKIYLCEYIVISKEKNSIIWGKYKDNIFKLRYFEVEKKDI